MVKITHGNVIISSRHPEASESAAQAIGDVLSGHWLDGVPEHESLVVTTTLGDGTQVPYIIVQSASSH